MSGTGWQWKQWTHAHAPPESDVICTCTTSGVPVFAGEWLKPGAHINAVGAFQPSKREVDDYTVKHARVIVETYDGAFAEAGDILIPMQQQCDHKIAHCG